MDKYKVIELLQTLSRIAGDSSMYDQELAEQVGDAISFMREINYTDLLAAENCHGVHEYEIAKVDCECLLATEKEVHDVYKCMYCGYRYHATPFYTEGK